MLHCKTVLMTVLDRCKKYSEHFHYPHEGMERALRFWLTWELFHNELQWEPEDIFIGEIFDMMFITKSLHPVVYVETKAPTDKIIDDREKFFNRIPGYGTIQFALYTNGWSWEKYPCIYVNNTLKMQKQVESIDLRNHDDNTVNKFFDPLSKKWFRGL